MNDYQISKKSSLHLILREAANFSQETSLIPRFASGIERLKAIVEEIDEIGILQAKDITGIADDKNVAMEEVIDYLVDVSGAMHSYANLKNDRTLEAKVNYKESTIENMSQPELINATAIVIAEAEKISPEELAAEGITATEMTAFKAAFAGFKSQVSSPREALIDRTGHTQRLADLFAEASDLKKNTLDRLMSQFKKKSPEFYEKYKAAAMVMYRRSPKAPVTAEV